MKLTARQKRILRAAREGHPPVILARRFRTTPNAMSTALARLRRAGYRVPMFGTSTRAPASEVQVHQAALKVLAAAAKRRGITTRRAARLVIVWAATTGQLPGILDQMECGDGQESTMGEGSARA
jgi:hypothetical protein